MGAISFPDPFRRLSVPPLAGLEGQGCGALGCRGAAGWLLSALPQRPSSFQCSHPNAFFQSHLHQGGCSGAGHLRLHCQGCGGACSTPFFRLLQPSVRSVEDLGVMASGHRPLPSHSLCGRVNLLVTFFASFSESLSTNSKRCALTSPRLRRSSPGSWLLFPLSSILWGSA